MLERVANRGGEMVGSRLFWLYDRRRVYWCMSQARLAITPKISVAASNLLATARLHLMEKPLPTAGHYSEPKKKITNSSRKQKMIDYKVNAVLQTDRQRST